MCAHVPITISWSTIDPPEIIEQLLTILWAFKIALDSTIVLYSITADGYTYAVGWIRTGTL